MKVALVYDRLNKLGGAERVLTSLHQLYPQAPFYTSVHNLSSAPFTKNWQVKPSFLQFIPFAKTHHELFPMLTPKAFESFDFKGYDLVISVTSAEAKGVITSGKTLHVCYCLTPTRYLWSHYHQYLSSLPKLTRPLARVLMSTLRRWDQTAAKRPDQYLAISATVKKRITKYYRRPSKIIYPPVNTGFFRPQKTKRLPRPFFLLVSRLVPYKRVDIAIKACRKLNLPLKIVGTGSQYKYLRQISGPTIQFLGKLTDKKLLGYYQTCQALIFPGLEDFGLTIVEAQSCGKPVIAYAAGGATEIVNSGLTGEFFDKLTVQSLVNVLTKFKPNNYQTSQIISSAKRFSQRKFKTNFKTTINHLWQAHLQKQKQ